MSQYFFEGRKEGGASYSWSAVKRSSNFYPVNTERQSTNLAHKQCSPPSGQLLAQRELRQQQKLEQLRRPRPYHPLVYLLQ